MQPGSAMINTPHVETEPENPTTVKEKVYYSRLDGNTYILKSGKVCKFYNGQYVTTLKHEQEELDALVKKQDQHEIYDHAVTVTKSDAMLMKDVGGGNQGGVVTGRPVSSADLAGAGLVVRK
jgi:hypothetical protein